MFELSVALKYLVPRKKQLSVSLIALLSTLVISTVVWLLLIFLSVTEGIEQSWLQKLTSLNAPIRIQPTQAYFNSYYYQIDSLSSDSDFRPKSLKEKLDSAKADPYSPDEDMEIPRYFPPPFLESDGNLKDLVKGVFASIDELKDPSLHAQEYEMGGALVRLGMRSGHGQESYLTQASYISTFSETSPFLKNLILAPSISDLNILLNQSHNLQSILEHAHLERLKSKGDFVELSPSMLSADATFFAYAHHAGNQIDYLILPMSKNQYETPGELREGEIQVKKGEIFFNGEKLTKHVPWIVQGELFFDVESVHPEKGAVRALATLQNQIFHLELFPKDFEVVHASPEMRFTQRPQHSPPWLHLVGNEIVIPNPIEGFLPVIAPKSMQTQGLHIKGNGAVTYGVGTSGSMQEQQVPIEIIAFYDPGIFPAGAKMLLAPHDLVHQLTLSNQSFILDPEISQGIQLWFKDLSKTREIAQQLQAKLNETGLAPFWKITPFYEYDFAKDLLQQFQSDKMLFSLVGILILAVAASNIISMLMILVGNKKKEIGILQAMGATRRSIALIFGICGLMIGLLSTLTGILAAMLTLKNIDGLAHFLSLIQGHDAFNQVFYGDSLPKEMSLSALRFFLIATPILSLIAALIPAIKASKMNPSAILRSES